MRRIKKLLTGSETPDDIVDAFFDRCNTYLDVVNLRRLLGDGIQREVVEKVVSRIAEEVAVGNAVKTNTFAGDSDYHSNPDKRPAEGASLYHIDNLVTGVRGISRLVPYHDVVIEIAGEGLYTRNILGRGVDSLNRLLGRDYLRPVKA